MRNFIILFIFVFGCSYKPKINECFADAQVKGIYYKVQEVGRYGFLVTRYENGHPSPSYITFDVLRRLNSDAVQIDCELAAKVYVK